MSRWTKKQEPVSATVNGAAQVTPLLSAESRSRLGDVLLSDQSVLPEQLAEALNLQKESGRQLGTILVEQGLLDARSLTRALATQLGLPTVDLRTVRPTSEALAYVSEEMARQLRIVPLELRDETLDVAIADGSSVAVREALSRLKVDHVNIYLAPPEDVLTCLNTYYRVLSDTDHNIKQFWDTAAARQEIEREIAATDEAPIIQLVNKIVTQALRDRASDIHIEPTDGRIRIRYRIDGALREVLSLPDTHRSRARQPHQDHGRHGHRRTTSSAGWPVRDDHRWLRRRCARRNRRDDLGRDCGASVARQESVDEAPVRARDAVRHLRART